MKYILLLLLTFSIKLLYSQWVSIGPDGGNSYNLITDGEVIYTETFDGVYLSKDNGHTWSLLNKGLIYNYVRDLTFFGNALIGVNISNNNYNTIYIHHLSTDSWTLLGTIPERQINSIAVKNNTIYAATDRGLYVSIDGGKIWTRSIPLLDTMYIMDIVVNNSSEIYAVSTYGLFLSNDGTQWTKLNVQIDQYTWSEIRIYNDAIYLINGQSGLIYVSRDKGLRWEALGRNQNFRVVTSLGFNNDDMYVGSYEGVYYSKDRGINWTSINNNLDYATASSFLILKDQTILVSTDRGIYRSTDKGINWKLSTEGLDAFDISYIASVKDKLFCSLGRRVNSLISENSGKHWNFITEKLPWGLHIYSIVKIDNTYLIGGNEGIYTFNPENLQWKSIINNLGRQIVFKIIIKDGGIFVSTTNGVYSSFDNGATWTERNNGLAETYILSMSSDQNNLFVGTGSGFYKSSDLGVNWINTRSNIPLHIRQLETSGNRIIAGTDDGIYTSDNEGLTWVKHNNGITNHNFRDILALDSLIFVGTGNGIFMSKDRGSSWKDISEGLDHKYVNSITVSNDYIFIGTNGSVWQRPLNQLITGDKNISTPISSLKIHSQLILHELHVTIPEDQKFMKLIIYNLNGKEIRQINSERNLSSLTIDVSNLAPGKYIVKAISKDLQVFQNSFIKM